MDRAFLTARWEHLAIVSYAVPDELLASRLPRGLGLDRLDGRACVSLVAFMFRDTRVRGVACPGHVTFPEVNLRFYVRDGEGREARRGVMFVREIVPRRFISAVARRVYNEPYVTRRLGASIATGGHVVSAAYTLYDRGPQRVRVEGDGRGVLPDEDTPEHWFKEHQWGFGVDRRRRTLTYEVRHPRWRVFPLLAWELAWDWGAVYGPEWAWLADAEPVSVVLAEGSAVSVHPASASGAC